MLIFSSYIFQNTRLPIILSGSYKCMPIRARIPASEYPYHMLTGTWSIRKLSSVVIEHVLLLTGRHASNTPDGNGTK
jgi:hypothetical protein